MQSPSAATVGPLHAATGNLAKNLLSREATGIRVKTPESAWSGGEPHGGGGGSTGGRSSAAATGGGGGRGRGTSGQSIGLRRPETSDTNNSSIKGGAVPPSTAGKSGRRRSSTKRARVNIDLSGTGGVGGVGVAPPATATTIRTVGSTNLSESTATTRREHLLSSRATTTGSGTKGAGDAALKTQIRVVTYNSKSASHTLDSRSASGHTDVTVRPVRRHIRIHIVSDKERAANQRADALSSDIAVPRAWQASQSLQKAQRKNRQHEQQLAGKLDTIDKGLAAQFNKITTYERRLVSEFLDKYPGMYDNVMAGFKHDKHVMRRIGIFPPPSTARDGSFRRMTDAAMQEAEAAIIRSQMRTPGGGEFPPLVRRKVQITTHTAAGTNGGGRRNRGYTLRSRSTPGGITLEGVKVSDNNNSTPTKSINTANIIREEKQKAKEAAVKAAAEHQAFSIEKSRSFIRTHGTGSRTAIAPGGTDQNNNNNVNVSQYVETDFGFHPERVGRTVSGMSLQKDIQDQGQLEKDIQQVAHKHIDAMTTSGQNGRISRKMEGAQNLRAVIVGKRASRNGPDAEGGSRRTTPSNHDDSGSMSGSARSARGRGASLRSTSSKVAMSPRRPKLKAGGPLPPLDKDITKVNVVGKADGDLVANVNIATTQDIGLDYFC